MGLRLLLIPLILGLGVAADAADKPPPAPPAAAPAKVSRSVSDAWNYNRLQRSVLEAQRDRIAAELARLEAERDAVAAQLKQEFQVDVVAGGTWDERTLEITRRK